MDWRENSYSHLLRNSKNCVFERKRNAERKDVKRNIGISLRRKREQKGKDARKKREKRDADDKMKKGKRYVRKEKLGNYNRKLTS